MRPGKRPRRWQFSAGDHNFVKEVLRTNDPVQLSFAESVLREAGIEPVLLDEGMASMYAGSLPFIERRIMVIDEEAHQARTILAEALRSED
jgi:hypothetical protein